MKSPTHSDSPARPPLPDPIKQPWDWTVTLASGDQRAIAIQRQRQHEAIELIKRRNGETPRGPDDNNEWDVLEALNKTRLEAGCPLLLNRRIERYKTADNEVVALRRRSELIIPRQCPGFSPAWKMRRGTSSM